ncbi:MAG: hypothetical protein ABSB77_24875 [Xanthobacteraceae bacterium]|jgi:hypothetical protein
MNQGETERADRPRLSDRIMLRFSANRSLDGRWIGTWETEAEPILQRIEEALRLIKRYDRIRYDRLLRDLRRVWVLLLPSSVAIFEYRIYTCEIDSRYCLAETTTPELLASAIVHEATHARLWRRGIRYEEAQRPRIEEICVRREIAFAAKLPNGEDARDQAERTLALCASGEYWTSAAFRERYIEGGVEVVRYMGAPGWLALVFRWLLVKRGCVRRGLARLKRAV